MPAHRIASSRSISLLLRLVQKRQAIVAFFIAAAFILSLCIAFNPRWESNDDVAMSMIAHGYGIAAYGSPYLVNSNVLWGYLVRVLPTINGVLGYSLATMAVLLVCGWAMLYFLMRLGAEFFHSLLAVSLLIAVPTLIPQFTVNAGLLTAAAVIGWQVYARLGGANNLVAACLLAFSGYLIRDKEFLLVLGVALPFLPWNALRRQRPMQAAFLLLAIAIALAFAFDHWSYSGPEWQRFLELNPAKTPVGDFLNFGAGEHLKQHPEISGRHGYSENDIDLVVNYFSVDPQLADPATLKAMLGELGPLSMQQGNIQSGWMAIKALLSPLLLPLLLAALLLFVLMPRWSIALAWMFCLAALFATGVMGRPGVVRIYLPLFSLLLVAPLALRKEYIKNIRPWVITLTLLIACIGNIYILTSQAAVSDSLIQQVQKDIRGFPAGPIVSWAGNFPFEFAFPVLANNLDSRKIRFYGLDSFTLAPFSVAHTEQTAGRGMIERLQTETGIPIIVATKQLELLRIYCQERLKGQLRGFPIHQSLSLTVHQVRCTKGG